MSKKVTRLLRWMFCVLRVACLPEVGAAEPLTTIPSLDGPRDMGTWYQIITYPNWFQKEEVRLRYVG